MRGRQVQICVSIFGVFKGNGGVGDHNGTYHIIKLLVRRVPNHTHIPSCLLGFFILTPGKNFPDLLHGVDQYDDAVRHAV